MKNKLVIKIFLLYIEFIYIRNIYGWSIDINKFKTFATKEIPHKIAKSIHSSDIWLEEKGVYEAVGEAKEWLLYKTGFGEQCSYVKYPSESVREHLKRNIRAQDRAIDSITSAIESWEFSKGLKKRSPLILALTGPTGTGKTEASNLIAEALFKRKVKLVKAERDIPTGLIVFRGEDYGDLYGNPINKYHEQIKDRLYMHLRRCSGNAVIVFDEVQKVIPHTLGVLMEAMSSRPQMTYYKDGVSHVIDTSNVIFIFVSDIGAVSMTKLMAKYTTRENIPHQELMRLVQESLDRQWQRLQLGKMIHQVVPFLPLEKQHISEIIDLKFQQIGQTYAGKYWNSLETEHALVEYLASDTFIIYAELSVTGDDNETIVYKSVQARYGARNVDNAGPLQQLKANLFRLLKPRNPNARIKLILLNNEDPEIEPEVETLSCSRMDSNIILNDSYNERNQTCISIWKGFLKK